MPPVREASTKPIAATVLPAPVACSNQKRLCALGSSGASASCSSSASLLGVVVERLLVLGDVLVDDASSSGDRPASRAASGDRRAVARRGVASARRPAPRRCRPLPFAPRWASASSAVSVPESASTWCGLSSVPSASLRLLVGEHALEAEHERVVAPPLGRRVLGARLELGERVVERAAARRARARAPPRGPRRAGRRARARTSRRARASPDREGERPSTAAGVGSAMLARRESTETAAATAG